MTKISPEVQEALEKVTAAQKDVELCRKEWQATWEEYSQAVRQQRARAVRMAYDMGAPKVHLGWALGTSDPHTPRKILAETGAK